MAFLYALPGAVAEGLIWGLMAIGVYISYKILDIADLTVDGSICTGACVCAVLLSMGVPAWASVLIALLAGAVTGIVTGTGRKGRQIHEQLKERVSEHYPTTFHIDARGILKVWNPGLLSVFVPLFSSE